MRPAVNIANLTAVTQTEAARQFGVTVQTIRRWELTGRLKGTRVGKLRFYPVDQLRCLSGVASPKDDQPVDDRLPMPPPIDPLAVYTKEQVAKLFGVIPKTIGDWETSGQIPPGYMQGKRRCWLGSTLLNDQRAKQQRALTEAGLSPGLV